MKNQLPFYSLEPSNIGGLVIEDIPEDISYATMPHQDDHYLVMILTEGFGTMELEGEVFHCTAPAMMVIKPLQVHFAHEVHQAKGWIVSTAPFLIPDTLAVAFQSLQIKQQYAPLHDAGDLIQIVLTLQATFNTTACPARYKPAIMKGLSDALFHRILPEFECILENGAQNIRQAAAITRQFMQLLQQEGAAQMPTFFAQQMHITPAHLNDCVRETTGYPLTYWRQYAMLNAAKRLLYYTDKPVKTIAWELGYEDHTYFSRLFRKLTGDTPGNFRSKFHE